MLFPRQSTETYYALSRTERRRLLNQAQNEVGAVRTAGNVLLVGGGSSTAYSTIEAIKYTWQGFRAAGYEASHYFDAAQHAGGTALLCIAFAGTGAAMLRVHQLVSQKQAHTLANLNARDPVEPSLSVTDELLPVEIAGQLMDPRMMQSPAELAVSEE